MSEGDVRAARARLDKSKGQLWSNATTRGVEDPEVKANDTPFGGTTETHPAYGQIGLSRASGGHSYLYGSDFGHQHTMRLRISRSERHRSLSRDWFSAHDEIIEVEMSEAQWAAFICSAGVGEGVPCTLRHVNRHQIPGIPKPESRVEQFSAEMSEYFAEAKALLDQLEAAVQAGPAGKREKLDLILQLRHRLGPNQAFVAKSFGEHMEEQISKAKIEVEAYMMARIVALGVRALQSGDGGDVTPPLVLGEVDGVK